MSWLNFFRGRPEPSSANIAKERLTMIVATGGNRRNGDDFLPRMQKDLMEVVLRYVNVDPSKVKITTERGSDLSTLAIEVELPPAEQMRRAG
ncbi:cell division topological specificity factor MinE [Humitalea sp. 24SJ18S-53]|uniref:cell division topological specificity factor MinE n=1 Tax=Humitalea sp. 24SJ18S-53 TaxID=3422307 RepID=UPI003D673636